DSPAHGHKKAKLGFGRRARIGTFMTTPPTGFGAMADPAGNEFLCVGGGGGSGGAGGSKDRPFRRARCDITIVGSTQRSEASARPQTSAPSTWLRSRSPSSTTDRASKRPTRGDWEASAAAGRRRRASGRVVALDEVCERFGVEALGRPVQLV